MPLFGHKNKVRPLFATLPLLLLKGTPQNQHGTNNSDFADDGTGVARQDYANQQGDRGNWDNTAAAGTGGAGNMQATDPNYAGGPTSATGGNQFGNQTGAGTGGVGGPGHHVRYANTPAIIALLTWLSAAAPSAPGSCG